MKKTRKFLSFLLALGLLFGLIPLAVNAENGPMDPEKYGWSMSYINFVELDEEGKSVLDENDESVIRSAFQLGKVLNEQPGAVYDLATNTLTLTDFDGAQIGLGVNAMGDDFKLEIVGDCKLAWIYVYGWGHGGSLYLTGNGLLTVNRNKIDESGIVLVPEGVDVTV